MASGQRHWHDEPGDGGEGRDHDEFGREGDDEAEFEFTLPSAFKFDFDDFSLKKFGKITDYDIGNDGLSLTLGSTWTFSIEGSGVDVVLNGKSELPEVTAGTIDSFEIDGPGGADFSISHLDMSARDFYQALVAFDAAKLLDLVLGGDETISGSGFGDFIYGGDGNDTMFGNKGRDWLVAGNGDDLVVGGSGNDYLKGECGADVFTFAPRSGMDLVSDFSVCGDSLDLTAYGFEGSFCEFLEEHTYSESRSGESRCEEEGDVVIDLGHGNSIKLEGVSRWALSAENVLL